MKVEDSPRATTPGQSPLPLQPIVETAEEKDEKGYCLDTSPIGDPSTPSTPKGSVDISRVRRSLTELRRTLATPELEEHKLPGSSPSCSPVCRPPRRSLSDADRPVSSDASLEIARLAKRLECMERAFLMSPTEAVHDRQQDTGAGELCAQFVEVLERGREARKREVADLERRMAHVESLCSPEPLRRCVEDHCREALALHPNASSKLAEALELESAARKQEVAELREAISRERVLSSTGGTSQCTSGEVHASDLGSSDVASEVALAVEAAVSSSKSALSQHVAELHQQLSEDLMEKLRETVSHTTAAWESRIQAVSELLERSSTAGPQADADCSESRGFEGPSMRKPDKDACRSPPISSSEAWSQSPPYSPMNITAEFTGTSIPVERDSPTPRGGLLRRRDSYGHASAADIAEEGISSVVVQPNVFSIRGASRDSLTTRQGLPSPSEKHGLISMWGTSFAGLEKADSSQVKL